MCRASLSLVMIPIAEPSVPSAFGLLLVTLLAGAASAQPLSDPNAMHVPRVLVRVGSASAPAELAPIAAQAAIRADGPAGATDLRADARCSATEPGVGIVVLSWTGPPSSGPLGGDRPQRVDLASVYRGFERQAFTSVWSLPPTRYLSDPPVQLERTASLLDGRIWVELRGLDPGGNDYWRVLTLVGDTWIASETARVEGPICPVDYRRPTRRPG